MMHGRRLACSPPARGRTRRRPPAPAPSAPSPTRACRWSSSLPRRRRPGPGSRLRPGLPALAVPAGVQVPVHRFQRWLDPATVLVDYGPTASARIVAIPYACYRCGG